MAPPSSSTEMAAVVDPSRIVQASFIEGASSKKDLARRLEQLLHVLRTEESIDADAQDAWPGLASTAAALIPFIDDNSNTTVRRLAVQNCLELFAIYAPEAPWSLPNVIRIFQQTIRLWANLPNTKPSHPAFPAYLSMLELFASVRIALVLVELETTVTTNADDDDSTTETQSLVPLLNQLVQTLLQGLRRHHPAVVQDCVVAIVTGIFDEYETGRTIPTPLLETILLGMAQGPTQLVTVLQDNKIPVPTPKPNPTFLACQSILQQCMHTCATPTAQLLTGLLTHTPQVVENSKIAAHPRNRTASDGDDNKNIENDDTDDVPDVYEIVYHLRHMPQLLVTVLGTVVSHGLITPDVVVRHAAVRLLGRFFRDATPVVRNQFRPCLQALCQRVHDAEAKIRMELVGPLTHLAAALDGESAGDEVVESSWQVLARDTDPAVRQAVLKAVAAAGDSNKKNRNESITATTAPIKPTPAMLHAVADRLASRVLDERQLALTILAKRYVHSYLKPILQALDNAHYDDDDSMSIVRTILHEHCGTDSHDIEEHPYAWIPRKIMQCICYSDQVDAGMRSRVIAILDEVLLGSSINSKDQTSGTQRAVGLAIILHSLSDAEQLASLTASNSDSEKFVRQLFRERAALQAKLAVYLEARSQARKKQQSVEAKLQSDAHAVHLLEQVAAHTAPPKNSRVLDLLHASRDQWIFSTLGTIAQPNQGRKARTRALTELPQRCQSRGAGVANWVHELARRCVQGDFLNAAVLEDSLGCAEKALAEGDGLASAAMLRVVVLARDTSPALCGSVVAKLQQVFAECNAMADPENLRTIQEFGLVTVLSSVLSVAAKVEGTTKTSRIENKAFEDGMMQLCLRDGTPEQSRYAVSSISRLPRQEGKLDELLAALAAPSRLTLKSTRIVSVLSSLTGFVECAPEVFAASNRKQKIVQFVLKTVLIGSKNNGERAVGIESISSPTPSKSTARRHSSRATHQTPPVGENLLEAGSLTIVCRRLCAAIEFLVTHVRSSILQQVGSVGDLPNEVWGILCCILKDSGLPPSQRDRQFCQSRQDRAALRQCSTVHLLRLCDHRLGLEKKLMSVEDWHLLGSSFLDEEESVRAAVMGEYYRLLKASGVFGSDAPPRTSSSAVSLRLISLTTLCTNSKTKGDNLMANGNAAIVGNVSNLIKDATEYAIHVLRNYCDTGRAQCRAMGEKFEKKFESVWKFGLMPEYTVPFALHLLAFRRETPSTSNSSSVDTSTLEDQDIVAADGASIAAQHKVLIRRLRWLLEPLVVRLGDRADNISFLLRMTEVIGKLYSPVLSDGSTTEIHQKEELCTAKLRVVCASARHLLLSFVKKDVDLAVYPGTVQIPISLFKKSGTSASRASQGIECPFSTAKTSHASSTSEVSDLSSMGSPQPTREEKRMHAPSTATTPTSHPLIKRTRTSFAGQFSPELLKHAHSDQRSSRMLQNRHSQRPRRSPRQSPTGSLSEAPTLGSTPPSALKEATMASTAALEYNCMTDNSVVDSNEADVPTNGTSSGTTGRKLQSNGCSGAGVADCSRGETSQSSFSMGTTTSEADSERDRLQIFRGERLKRPSRQSQNMKGDSTRRHSKRCREVTADNESLESGETENAPNGRNRPHLDRNEKRRFASDEEYQETKKKGRRKRKIRTTLRER